jgi:uncharacterized protein YlaI
MKVNCVFCKTEHLIDSSDPVYNKLKGKQISSFVCKKCNNSIQSEVRRNVDFNPELIDSYKFSKLIP